MANTTRGREVYSNQTVLDQVDYFQLDGFTRVFGLLVSDLQEVLFVNNTPVGWPLVNGTVITDAQIVSGKVYFHEIPTQPGYYNVRFRPNQVGYWRLTLSYAAGTQIMAQDYDVLSEPVRQATGLKPSFVCKS